ncbi:MAG: pyridoxamine 5'-phosphate oxidase family protein [Chloroflexota bacterium]
MGKVVPEGITDTIREFIAAQQMFFVGSAPLSEEGHVNISPKGMDSFRILGEATVGYMDMTGSGNETSAHIHENGRITFMFCAFEGPANIVRLYGTGRVALPGSQEWAAHIDQFEVPTGARQLILADIDRVSTSCGYAVPYYDFKAQRQTLTKYWAKKDADEIQDYQHEKNLRSIDGLLTPLGDAAGD